MFVCLFLILSDRVLVIPSWPWTCYVVQAGCVFYLCLGWGIYKHRASHPRTGFVCLFSCWCSRPRKISWACSGLGFPFPLSCFLTPIKLCFPLLTRASKNYWWKCSCDPSLLLHTVVQSRSDKQSQAIPSPDLELWEWLLCFFPSPLGHPLSAWSGLLCISVLHTLICSPCIGFN